MCIHACDILCADACTHARTLIYTHTHTHSLHTHRISEVIKRLITIFSLILAHNYTNCHKSQYNKMFYIPLITLHNIKILKTNSYRLETTEISFLTKKTSKNCLYEIKYGKESTNDLL